MESDLSFKLLDSYIHPLCIDCVYFFPNTLIPGLLLAGIYHLDSETGLKHGGFLLFSTEKEYLINFYYSFSCENSKLELIQCERTSSGVLDLKPVEFMGNLLVFCICIDGSIPIYQLKPSISSLITVNLLKTINLSASYQGLYLDLHLEQNNIWILASFEPNIIARICLNQTLDVEVEEVYMEHTFTPWICAFSRDKPSLFVSGGDDMKLTVYSVDKTQNYSENTQPSYSVMTNKKNHTMGITALLFPQNEPNYLISGSFDQKLRLWDIRNLKDSVSEMEGKGGVWRIREMGGMLGIAESFGQCGEVVELVEKSEFKLRGSFGEHESLVYGIDWKNESIMASCSFYDKKINLWQVNK